MPARIDDNIACLLDFGHRYVTNSLSKRFSEHGYDLTADQFLILRNLWEQDGVSQQLLACFTQKNKVSIVKLLDRLEARELVRRENSPTDRRAKLIYLTARGRELRQVLTGLADENLRQLVDGIAPGDLASCKQTIRKILENVVRMNCEPITHH